MKRTLAELFFDIHFARDHRRRGRRRRHRTRQRRRRRRYLRVLLFIEEHLRHKRRIFHHHFQVTHMGFRMAYHFLNHAVVIKRLQGGIMRRNNRPDILHVVR